MKIIAESIDATGEFRKSPAFEDYKSLLDEIAGMRSLLSRPDDRFFKDAELLVRYSNFTKIGKGSSRTAYTFDADPRYVLKFAHNRNGIRQNQTELKNEIKGDYACLVRVLEYDIHGVFIVEDRCRQSRYEDWYRIIGIGPNMLSKIVRIVFERREKDGTYSIGDLLSDIKNPADAARILRKTS